MLFQGGDQGGLEDDFGEQRTNKPHSGQTNQSGAPVPPDRTPAPELGPPTRPFPRLRRPQSQHSQPSPDAKVARWEMKEK